jgi:hypothetical protein
MAKTNQMSFMRGIEDQNRNNHCYVSSFINRGDIHGEIQCHGKTGRNKTAQCLVMPAVPAGMFETTNQLLGLVTIEGLISLVAL